MRLDASWSSVPGGSGRKSGICLSSASSRVGASASASSASSRRQKSAARSGQQSPGDDQRATDLEGRDENRREDRSEAERADEDALHDSEHARQHLVRNGSLEQRQPGDVDERDADADDGQEEQRHRRLGEQPDHQDRQAPEHEPDREVRAEAIATDERERAEAAEEPSDPDRRVEEPDARLAEVEQLEGRDDDQHVERAGDQRLRAVEPDDQPQARVAPDRGEACEALAQHATGARCRFGLRRCRTDAGEEQRREQERDRGGGEDRVHADQGQQDAANRRPDEDADALDRRQHEVRRGQLLG